MTRFLLILCVLYSTAIAGDESHQVRKKVHLETITGILRAYAPGHAQYSQRVDVIPLEGPRVDTLPDLFFTNFDDFAVAHQYAVGGAHVRVRVMRVYCGATEVLVV
jgi:hypothetical protein